MLDRQTEDKKHTDCVGDGEQRASPTIPGSSEVPESSHICNITMQQTSQYIMKSPSSLFKSEQVQVILYGSKEGSGDFLTTAVNR